MKAEKEGILNVFFIDMFLLHIKGTVHNTQNILGLTFKFSSLKENKSIGYGMLKKISLQISALNSLLDLALYTFT